MKKLKNLIFIIFFFSSSLFINSLKAETIVYIDMDKIMQLSKAGKAVQNKLNKQKKDDIQKFQKIEKNLKDKEDDLVKKKNVLSNEEFNKKLNSLKSEIEEYRTLRQKKIDESTKNRLNASADFAKKIKPILAEYAAQNSIDMVIQKKNIIMGKSELDITNDVLKIVDKKIDKLKID